MIIRDGFVTNSSSTNFMIISKEELSSDYLLEKLGFRKGSSISAAAFSLVMISLVQQNLEFVGLRLIKSIMKIF